MCWRALGCGARCVVCRCAASVCRCGKQCGVWAKNRLDNFNFLEPCKLFEVLSPKNFCLKMQLKKFIHGKIGNQKCNKRKFVRHRSKNCQLKTEFKRVRRGVRVRRVAPRQLLCCRQWASGHTPASSLQGSTGATRWWHVPKSQSLKVLI